MYTLGTHPSTSFRSIFWPFTVGSSSIPSLCCCSDFAINTQLETISCLTNLEVKEWIQWYFLHISGSVCNWRFYDTGCTCIQWFHSHVFTNFMPVGWKANRNSILWLHVRTFKWRFVYCFLISSSWSTQQSVHIFADWTRGHPWKFLVAMAKVCKKILMARDFYSQITCFFRGTATVTAGLSEPSNVDIPDGHGWPWHHWLCLPSYIVRSPKKDSRRGTVNCYCGFSSNPYYCRPGMAK